MAHRIELKAAKTYATEANVEKAIAKVPSIATDPALRYFIMRSDDGRFFPVFIGGESSMQKGVHFHFNVVG